VPGGAKPEMGGPLEASPAENVRQECLDHVIILGECRLLNEFTYRYFNTSRPHQGIGQRIPVPEPWMVCVDPSDVIALPVLGGLHHDYRRAA
jgi:putative transposase